MTTNNNRTRRVRSQALPAPRTSSRRSLKAMFTAMLLAVGSLLATPAVLAAPAVIYNEPAPDLAVKVLGGKLVVQRSFIEGKWYSNANWAPLKLTYDTLDGSVKSITRGRAEYARISPGVFRDASYYTIRQTSTGFTWADRAGNTIDYDAKGYIKGYADRNGVKVSFTSETTSGGATRLTGAFDHHGNQALWFDYTGDDLTRIRDRTNREVRYQYNSAHELTQVTDANGHPWTYTYSGGVPVTFTDPENRTVKRTWAGNGELASIRYADNTGVDYLYEYDSGKSLYYTQEKTTGGKVTETWSTLDGKLLRKDINGKTVETRVPDSPGNRTRTTTDARGLTTTEALDEWGNVTQITYPDGSSTRATFEPTYSNPLTRTDELGVVTKYEYDAKGNLTRMTEALGLAEQRETEYSYDQYGQRKASKRLANAVTEEATIQFAYNEFGNIVSVTDPSGFVTTYSYDVQGNAVTKVDARGKVWRREFDKRGQPTTVTDPLSHTETTAYDKAGWKAQFIDVPGNSTQFSYDVRGNVIAITDPYGVTGRQEYNSDNQLTRSIDPENRSEMIEYDKDGRISKQIDGNGNATSYFYGDEASGLNSLHIKTVFPTYSIDLKYDVRNRVTKKTEKLDSTNSRFVLIGYDARGYITSKTDTASRTTHYAYDALGRLVKITDPAGGVTEYSYDARDNRIAVKNPKGVVFRFAFDLSNRLITEIRPGERSFAYGYDPTGNLVQVTDAKGQVKRFAYDDANRLTEERHFLSATDSVAAKSITFSYNDLNEVSGYNDGTSVGTTTFDARQLRKIGESINFGAFSLGYSYDYYANGQIRSFTAPDGMKLTYAYDTNNQLSTIEFPHGNITVNSYKWFAPSQLTFPGGAVRTQGYDPLLRLTQVQVKDPGQGEVMAQQYSYDNEDNVNAKNTEQGNYKYVYDELYRLTQATNPEPLQTESYGYDPVGNRLTDGGTNGSWSYNDADQLQGFDEITFKYDANGNVARKSNLGDPGQNRVYVYDTADRLIEVRGDDGGLIATYTYDPYGRRISKELAGSSGSKTWFLYSNEGLVAEADNIGTVTKSYGYRPGGSWMTDPVYLKQGSDTFYFQTDHLGTPQKLIAQNGAVVWSAMSEAFGVTKVDANSTVVNNLRFAGQYYDAETGLHYNWNRYYDPSVGRYLSSDPIGLEGGLNVYQYVDGNPLNLIDPSGLIHCVYIIAAEFDSKTGAPRSGRMTCWPDDRKDGEPSMSFKCTSGNNDDTDWKGDGCWNNPWCTGKKNVGPIPPGSYVWNKSQATKADGKGRVSLNPKGHDAKDRDSLQTHSCTEPWGPTAAGPSEKTGKSPCSEGCITCYAKDIKKLNRKIKKDNVNTLEVKRWNSWF